MRYARKRKDEPEDESRIRAQEIKGRYKGAIFADAMADAAAVNSCG